MLRRLFEARLVNQRTRWRDLVNGYDPASIPGLSAEQIQRMESMEETKEDGTTFTVNLVNIVREGFVKNQ